MKLPIHNDIDLDSRFWAREVYVTYPDGRSHHMGDLYVENWQEIVTKAARLYGDIDRIEFATFVKDGDIADLSTIMDYIITFTEGTSVLSLVIRWD